MSRIAAAVLTLFCLAALAGVARAEDAARTLSVRLDWITSGYQAPFYLAAEKGWFDKAGIAVAIEPGSGSATTIQLIAGGKYDVGEAALSNMALARGKGVGVTSIAGFFRTGDVALLVPVDSTIKSPADLKGKRLIFSAGSFEGPFLDDFLAAGGVSRGEVQILNIDFNTRNAVYGKGGADGMFGSPVGTLILLDKVKPSRAILFADFGLNLPGFGLVTTPAALKAKGPALRAFASAVAGAWTYILAGHEDEAVAAVLKARPGDRVDADQIHQQLHNSIPFLSSPGTAGQPIGFQSTADWAKTIAVMEKAGALQPGSQPADYFTNDYLDAATIAAFGKS